MKKIKEMFNKGNYKKLRYKILDTILIYLSEKANWVCKICGDGLDIDTSPKGWATKKCETCSRAQHKQEK